MRIRLCVEHLLGLDRERHIAVSQLADAMGVTRHQLLHLLDNDAPQINRRVLEAVCEYLVGHGRVAPEDLFQQVFALELGAFWPMLAGRQRIELNLGVRWQREKGQDQQVMAADSVLQSVLVNRLTGVTAENREHKAQLQHHAQQVISSQLALSWGYAGSSMKAIQATTRSLFKQFVRQNNDKAIVCLGSIKSNPVCDLAIARGFRHAKEFQSEDGVASGQQRSCPFVMIYRNDDPHPPSCWGGRRLCKSDRHPQPGISYERAPGDWHHVAATESEDVALVYYRYLKGPQNLEMVLAGYTGRSTRCVAEMLRTGAAGDFWPPAVDTTQVAMGAFVVKFGYRRRRKSEGINVRSHDLWTDTEVITLSKECLESRLAKPRE